MAKTGLCRSSLSIFFRLLSVPHHVNTRMYTKDLVLGIPELAKVIAHQRGAFPKMSCRSRTSTSAIGTIHACRRSTACGGAVCPPRRSTTFATALAYVQVMPLCAAVDSIVCFRGACCVPLQQRLARIGVDNLQCHAGLSCICNLWLR